MTTQNITTTAISLFSLKKSSRADKIWLLGSAVVIIGLTIWSFLVESNIARGYLLLALMLVLLMLNVNIGISMAIPGLLGVFQIVGIRGFMNMVAEVPFSQTASFTLSVLPMFVMMGLLLWRSGLTSDLYTAARAWLGWLPGGLAITTNLAGAGLGAASGSTMGITYAVGRIGIPEMLRAGYDKRLALGAVASAGTIGQLIPPSILLVVYANFAEVPVGPQLMAGILPGLLLTAAYILFILVIVMIKPSIAPKESTNLDSRWSDRWIAVGRIWPLVLLIVAVIGGMAYGIFTPTEAGAFGAGIAFVLALWKVGRKSFGEAVGRALRDTISSVGVIMFLLIGATLLNRMIALTGLARVFGDYMEHAGFGPVMFIIVLVILFLVLGLFMEPLPMLLIMVPIILPLVLEMGYSALWFGVFIVLMGEVALLSPPVGMLVFLVHRIAQDKDVNLGQKITLGNTYMGALWFTPLALAVVFILAIFPEIVDWIPSLMQQ